MGARLTPAGSFVRLALLSVTRAKFGVRGASCDHSPRRKHRTPGCGMLGGAGLHITIFFVLGRGT